jgi:hypothetical protein
MLAKGGPRRFSTTDATSHDLKAESQARMRAERSPEQRLSDTLQRNANPSRIRWQG